MKTNTKNIEELQSEVARLCPGIDDQTRNDFFTRMDEAYFAEYPAKTIAGHLRMSAELSPESPVQTGIKPAGKQEWDLEIVAYDYFSVFSILCGLMASFGLDIQSGSVYTFAKAGAKPAPRSPWRRPPVRTGTFKRKIVDVFRIGLLPGRRFGPEQQSAFKSELTRLIRLLEEGGSQEAREAVNRRLIESLAGQKAPLRGLDFPVDIRFDNTQSDRWTVLEIHSRDTPAFLYAFSNALAMRGVYIHGVRIKNAAGEAHDWLYVTNRLGNRIETKADQDHLRVAAATIKQFTPFLAAAPDPARAVRYFDQFLDKIMASGRPAAFLNRKKSLEFLARLLGTSDFLWEDFLRIQFDHLLPVLKQTKPTSRTRGKKQFLAALRKTLRTVRKPEDQKEKLNTFKDREMFRIDMEHLAEKNPDLPRFSRSLTDLSEAVLEEAVRIALRLTSRRHGPPRLKNGKPCPFAVFGLGKFGGREMGYASDIELQFLFGGPGRTSGRTPADNADFFEKVAREILSLIEARQEGIFHVDLRLRPDGDKGPLTNPLARFVSYYSPDGEAAPFERQSLTKFRWVAGDEKLGRQAEAHRDRFVYSEEPWDLKAALHLRDRQIAELVSPGTVNVKYSPGGVIEAEYTAQYLQVMHGARFPDLRTPTTLEALDKIKKRKLISADEETVLKEGYLYLRKLIDALRIVRGNARDLMLPDRKSEEFTFLARRMGYQEEDWKKAGDRLAKEVDRHMKTVNSFFNRTFRNS